MEWRRIKIYQVPRLYYLNCDKLLKNIIINAITLKYKKGQKWA